MSDWKPKITILPSLDDLDPLIERAASLGSEQARVRELCYHAIIDPILQQLPDDPFSQKYKEAILSLHARISKRPNYDPRRDELIYFDVNDRAMRPGIYRDGDSTYLGSFLEATGQILLNLNVGPGSKVLEYGPGDGQIALTLARMGCDVTVVDIEERYLSVIEKQEQMLGVSITKVHGEFIGDYGLNNFDRIIFFETFHHALDHFDLLQHIKQIIKPTGQILFAGEPIIPEGDFWSPTVPFPWGLRLDALSLSQVRNSGWMELGFQESYFMELLNRTGWRTKKITSSTNGRATSYIAELNDYGL